MAQGNANGNGPHQNADVVGVHEGADGVVHGVFEHLHQHFSNAARCGHARGCVSECQRGGEQHAGHDTNDGGGQRANGIQPQNRAQVGGLARAAIADGGNHQDKHQNRSNCFQGRNKQCSE